MRAWLTGAHNPLWLVAIAWANLQRYPSLLR
jgi:hypothetical protein